MTAHDATDHDTRSPNAAQRPASTALAVVEGSGGTDRRVGDRRSSDRQSPRAFRIVHPDASFVAQLIATAAQMPQTRGLRRASPEDAETSYRAAAANTTTEQAAADVHTTVRVA